MLSNGDVFAEYVIERQLGRGGMGSVYLAKHPRLPRMTALKLLNREMVFDKEIRARFEREADLVAQLDHHNIVTVYDRGLADGQLWISMQFVDGVDAAGVNPQTLPPERAVQIVAETADALDYAHRNGVLHRDVKPANILLARSTGGKGERVYLTDFGIARLRDDSGHLTQTGTFTATLAYASPEQLTGSALDGSSDQYSLACTLFWLLTGTGPFSATNPAAVIQGHLQNPPPLLSTARPGLPPSLDQVMAKAMAKRPEDRFATCSDFAAAAKRALANPSAPAIPLVGHRTAPPMPVQPPPYTGSAMTAGAPQTSPYTGVPMQTRPPSTGGPIPTAVPRPQTAASAPYPTQLNTATPPPQTLVGGYQGRPPTNQYTQPPAYSYAQPPGQQRPPTSPVGAPHGMPPKKSNTGWIIAAIVTVLVLIIVVVAVVAAGSGKKNKAAVVSPGGTTQTTKPTAGSPGTAADKQVDWSSLSKEFPKLLPATKSGDKGYDSASCWMPDKTTAEDKNDDAPDFGNWAVEWRCFGGNGNDDPFYRLYAYSSAADLQSVVSALNPASTTKDANGGKTYTNYRFTDNSRPRMVTVFTGDSNRTQFLMYTDGVAGSMDSVVSWWKQAPLN
ncbi:serine/threonine protein kinase [Nocardia sp. NBC_00511]|uniref:serine/threonine protein kinase n=1 Tax=Nocardia sp. NBC_00511 TaxID=2903591 RepID=UPI0030E49A5E